MNKNFSTKVIAVCVCLISFTFTIAQSSSLLNFTGAPKLVSGVDKQVNAVYLYTNVASGLDAFVTIVSANGGATIDVLDDDYVADPENFSPKINVLANSTGLIQFRIDFVLSALTSQKKLDSLFVTALNIDGNNNLHEIDIIDLGGGAANCASANPEITISQSGTAFTALNVAGIEYASIDTITKQVMFTVKSKSVATLIYTAGAINNNSYNSSRQKSLYFRSFTYSSYSTLPVKYVSFDGMINGQNVLLKWIASEEINNSHFEIEHSFDRISFKTIGVVMDGFADGSNKSYQFKESMEALNGNSIVYYRLKQFDRDGSYTYSKVIAIRLLANPDAVHMQVLPNPFAENLAILYDAASKGFANLQIINATGLQVINKQILFVKGANNLKIDGLGNLSNGMYVARLVVDGKIIASEKMIKN